MEKHRPPVVLISGGGIGGLVLAILLERANIPYHIFEKAPTVKPLGAALVLNANILPAFDQLGLLERLTEMGYPMAMLDLCKESLKPIGSIDVTDFKEKTGYDFLIFHRPDVYDLILSHVPAKKISFNKKVVWLLQNDEGVMIRTSDNETYHGDILVGADGAFSAVRQNLYRDMAKKNVLPTSDAQSPKVDRICLVGTTRPLDTEDYPELKDKRCHFTTVIGQDKAHTWMTCTLPNNRICFSIRKQLNEEASKEAMFRTSEWTPEQHTKMIREVYNFPISNGREGDRKVLGDLIDATDPESISQVFVEDKLYETWHYGRTVLIGDAVHKMAPNAGQGGVNAMEDAVVLANCLYEISDGKQAVTPERIAEAFRDYREQRYIHAKYQVENSANMTKILSGQVTKPREDSF
ncbi:hypothetical protein BGX34_006087 [Mortierella sp. NVP85]|nr:hypothetical protein BGX34_006087 [Mortierella sp. NVP85]